MAQQAITTRGTLNKMLLIFLDRTTTNFKTNMTHSHHQNREKESVRAHLRESNDKFSKELGLPARSKHRNQRSEG